jgi:hypothetical protein
MTAFVNPPLKGDHLAPFVVTEPGKGVYSWNPGRVTVLCSFAYWCDTWKTQSERLMAARQKLSGLPIEFLAVSVDGQWMDVDQKANWSRRLVDVGSRWSSSIGIDRVPYTLVIDKDGTIQWTGYGISRSDDIVQEARESVTGSAKASNVVYVSFDDFPAKSGNAELLDALRRAGVHASLFVIGENAEQDPKWTQQVMEIDSKSTAGDTPPKILTRCNVGTGYNTKPASLQSGCVDRVRASSKISPVIRFRPSTSIHTIS